ncbi:response regulator [soil metagenome]|jgi:two-component system chemotaxis response regulator CheY
MKLQVLIIDDDASILRLLSFILSKDYDLVIKNSGLEALAWLEEGNSPALAICDLDMPYIDGQTMIKNLKISGIHRDIPVIILSASDRLAEEVNKMDFAVNGFIQKPFNPVVLKAAIANVLKTHTSAA